MSRFLEQRRDWQLDQIVKDRDKGLLSYAAAQEKTLEVYESYDRAKRWRDHA